LRLTTVSWQKLKHLLLQAGWKAKKRVIARAKLGVGVFYASAGRFEDGEKLLSEALSSFSKGNDYDHKQGYGWAFLNLGGLYGKQCS
jgi:hypothetical protein